MEKEKRKKTKREEELERELWLKNQRLTVIMRDTSLSSGEILDIALFPVKDNLKSALKSKLMTNGTLNKYPTLRDAKEACNGFKKGEEDYVEAWEAWEWYSSLRAVNAPTYSMVVDAFHLAPERSDAKRLAVFRLLRIKGLTISDLEKLEKNGKI